jgi:hypothetical protein
MIDIRAASDADKSAVLEFTAQAANPEKAETLSRRWHWQWHLDPRLDEPGYKGVVAEWNGSIIGNIACMPAGLYIHGEPRSAVWFADARIHWGLVRKALRDLAKSGQRKGDVLPNGLAAALFDHPAAGSIQLGKHIAEAMMTIGYRVGFVAMPAAGNNMRRISYRWPLQKALGTGAGAAVALLADLTIRRLPRPKLEVTPLQGAFDARFDRLWDRSRRHYPAITLRDAAVLNWHYREHPDTTYHSLVVERGAEVRGYLVFKVWVRKDRRIARIVDLLTDKDDLAAAEALLAAAMRALRKEGAERVDWFVCGAQFQDIVRRLGFVPRLTNSKKPQPLMTRRMPEVELYVTSGDGDGG